MKIEGLVMTRQLNQLTNRQAGVLEKLSSGLRINRAGDDAAGLSISQGMKAQIRALSQATRNVQDGISLLQVADGAMAEIQAMIDRGVELSLKSQSGVLNSDDLGAIQEELLQISREIDHIYMTTSFNGRPLLQGSEIKEITKTETKLETVVRDEIQFGTKGELPDWVFDENSNSSSLGYLTNKLVTFNETFYTMTNDRIVRSDGVQVNAFKTDSGIIYTEGSTRVETSAPDGLAGSITFRGDDGYDYTIERSYVPFVKEQSHAGSFIDFSGLDRGESWTSLIETGFQTTCCSCEKRYSIKFTDGESGVEKDGDHYIYNVNIAGVGSSGELLSRVMNVLSSSGRTETRVDDRGNSWEVVVPENHFTGFAIEKDTSGSSTGRLLIYDFPNSTYDRKPNPSKEQGIFGTGYYGSEVIQVEETVLVTVETKVTVGSEDLVLQIGDHDPDQLIVKLPDVSLEALGLSEKLDVLSGSISRQETTDSLLNSKVYLSQERGRLGAVVNRLDSIERNLGNHVLNLTEAKSRIQDTDMPKIMSELTKLNVLTQATQSLFTPLTDRATHILELLK